MTLNNRCKTIFVLIAFLIISTITFAQGGKTLRTIIVDAGHGGTDVGAVGQYENSLKSLEKNITLAIATKLVKTLKKRVPEVRTIPTRTTDVFQTVKEKANIANENKGDLFLCIHADSGPLKTGKRQVGSKTVTKYRISYKGTGKKKKKISTPYEVEVPIYEYYKMPLTREGTSVWIFAAHKTDDKLKAIANGEDVYEPETHADDSSVSPIDYNSPQGRAIAQIYAKKFQEKSDRIAQLVNEEVEKKGRPSLGVNQRQTGIWVLQATNMPAILVETGFINNPEDEAYLNSDKGQQELADAITDAVIKYKAIIDGDKTAKRN